MSGLDPVHLLAQALQAWVMVFDSLHDLVHRRHLNRREHRTVHAGLTVHATNRILALRAYTHTL
jgi:hypothetical protein